MIGGRRLNKEIPTLNYVTCPACSKDRLLKKVEEEGVKPVASDEVVDVRGEARFLDVCEFCRTKYRKSDERFVMENLKKIQKAAHADNRDKVDSDHQDFTLDL